MSKETLSWLNTRTLIGFTSKRGNAWHYKAEEQGDETNHYELAIPVNDVVRRLFFWNAVEGSVQSTVLGEDGVTLYEDDDRKTIIRPRGTFGPSDKGEILGIFKGAPNSDRGYQQHNYREWLLEVSSNILGDTLAISSAGLLRGGALAWVEISVPENITTPEGVEFRPNLLAHTSLDGSFATTYGRKVTNVVCDNTHEAAAAEVGQKYKVRHSRYSGFKLDDARKAVSLIHETAEQFQDLVTELCSTKVSDTQWKAFLEAHEPTQGKTGASLTIASGKHDSLNRLWKHDERVAPWKGNAWGVLQAVSTFEHHEKTVRGLDRVSRNQLRTLQGDFGNVDANTLTVLNKVLATV
jgi:phage/plasmid-like protein (TIGR03299 family)